MDGAALLDEVAKRVMKRNGTSSVSDPVLARELGLTVATMRALRGKTLTPLQVAGLMEKAAKAAQLQLIDSAIVPVVEFFPIDPVLSKREARWHILDPNEEDEPHPYRDGLKTALTASHGVYVFHDSSGRAIYAGKADRLDLWTEINNAFNRDRKEVQAIKRVSHPTTRKEFRGSAEIKRQIRKELVALHHIAAYFSAYQVEQRLIGKLEALIVRSFANDLLNVRMENF